MSFQLKISRWDVSYVNLTMKRGFSIAVHQICFTFGGFVAEDPRECSLPFCAFWTHDKVDMITFWINSFSDLSALASPKLATWSYVEADVNKMEIRARTIFFSCHWKRNYVKYCPALDASMPWSVCDLTFCLNSCVSFSLPSVPYMLPW